MRWLLTGVVSLFASMGSVQAADRPNILWLVAEDFGPELGCYGTTQVWTPNLDRLATQGVRYTRAYTTAPVCSASRSAFMTGMYQTTIGAHNHRSHRDDGYQLPSGVRLIPERMHDAGYFTANVRAFPRSFGFSGTGKTDWNFAHNPKPFDSDRWSDLKQRQPFFAQVNFVETHRKFQAPKRADPEKVAIAPYYPDHPVTRRDMAEYLDAASELDRKIGLILNQLETDGLADSTIVVFTSDHGQAHVRGKQFCYEEGLHVPLIIRWPKKFPAPKDFHSGTVENRMVEAIDLAPTFLAIAGVPKPEGMEGRVFLGDRAEAPREYVFGARDRCDETVFRLRTVRDDHYRYIRNFTPERPFLQPNQYKEKSYPVWNLLKELDAQGKLTPVQKVLTAPTMPPEELYDLDEDPHEIHNLVASDRPKDRAALERLRKVLERWLVETDDKGKTLEPVALAAAKGVTKPSTPPNTGYSPAPLRPNIIVILADDIGYGDLGCYGATKVKTPNLDRLARGGMRFTDAHSPSAVCTPTRYALLTGQYAWRHQPGSQILSGIAPLSIPNGRLTLPLLLKRNGYATGVVGKWHLGLGTAPTDYNGEITPGPREVGFGYSFIIPATGDRVPCVYVENQHVVGYDPSDPIRVSYGQPVGDEPTGAKNPELLKVKPSHGHDNTIINGISRIGFMTGGHKARWKDEDMADTITRKAVEFIAAHAKERFFLDFNTHDVHVPRVPHPRFQGTSQCGTRGDVIQELDWSVGEILAALDKHGLTNDTLVVFTSDNGGVMDDGYQDGSGNDSSGHRCNGALRGFKGGLYEGGSRVPFIARWPGKVPADSTSKQLICHTDLIATAATLVGKDLPAGAGPDSFDQLPALLAETPVSPCRETLVMHSGGGRLAVRKGPWKLIPGPNSGANPGKGAPREPELYNLADDLGETKNLAREETGKVKELAELLGQLRTQGDSRTVQE